MNETQRKTIRETINYLLDDILSAKLTNYKTAIVSAIQPLKKDSNWWLHTNIFLYFNPQYIARTIGVDGRVVRFPEGLKNEETTEIHEAWCKIRSFNPELTCEETTEIGDKIRSFKQKNSKLAPINPVLEKYSNYNPFCIVDMSQFQGWLDSINIPPDVQKSLCALREAYLGMTPYIQYSEFNYCARQGNFPFGLNKLGPPISIEQLADEIKTLVEYRLEIQETIDEEKKINQARVDVLQGSVKLLEQEVKILREMNAKKRAREEGKEKSAKLETSENSLMEITQPENWGMILLNQLANEELDELAFISMLRKWIASTSNPVDVLLHEFEIKLNLNRFTNMRTKCKNLRTSQYFCEIIENLCIASSDIRKDISNQKQQEIVNWVANLQLEHPESVPAFRALFSLVPATLNKTNDHTNSSTLIRMVNVQDGMEKRRISFKPTILYTVKMFSVKSHIS